MRPFPWRLSFLLLAVVAPAPSHATPVAYEIRFFDPFGDPFPDELGDRGAGAVADDAGFAPDALVPLDVLSFFFDFAAGSIAMDLSDCVPSPEGRVGADGVDLVAVGARCVDVDPFGFGLDSTLTLGLDGTFEFVVIPNVVTAFGSYELERVPEPGIETLALGAAIAAALLVRRRPEDARPGRFSR